MLVRSVLITAIAAGSSLIGAATAVGDPAPAPTPTVPDVAAFPPVNPADYTVNGGKWYAFAGPTGVICVLDALKGDYGCAGLLPGAPEGVNLVSAGPSGVPTFTATGASPYLAAGPVKPLPPNTRLSFRSTFCGVDTDGVLACLNTREGVGFVVAPEYTSIIAPPPPPPPAEPGPELLPEAPVPAPAMPQ